MDFFAMAKQFVCSVIAAALSLTVGVVERMLSHRPEWLERIAVLESQYRALAAGNEKRAASEAPKTTSTGRPQVNATEHADGVPHDLQGLIDGYGKLLEFVQHIKSRGLMLDAEFCERVEREWSVKTLLSYMVATERSLKEQATEVHQAAASLIGARYRED